MPAEKFMRRSRIAAPAGEVYRWHSSPGALERLTPPWDRVSVEARSGALGEGATVTLRLRVGPLRFRWVAEHRDFVEGRRFVDVQVSGPFAKWEHTHVFEPEGTNASAIEDRIRYRLPFGPLGWLLAGGGVRRRLDRLFRYRHGVTADDLAHHARYAKSRPAKILVSGASGLVGSALVPFLTAGEEDVVRLVRRTPAAGAPEIRWDPDAGRIDEGGLEGFDAVVHLAGESIADGRWNGARKRKIRESRVAGTRLLAEALARAERPPRVLVSASAIGFYGDRGDERLDETSPGGSGFLPEVCREWEAATAAAEARGIRVVHLRIGIVLSAAGGALAKMCLPFRFGLGGKLGSGRQFWSWISLDDLVASIHHAIRTESLRGPVNAVAPEATTMAGLARSLAHVLRRPAVVPVPARIARALFGEMADAFLLSSARVAPRRLLETGYRFRDPDLESALRRLLGRETAGGRG